MSLIISKMIKSRRLEYVAKMARDLVRTLREKCRNVKWYKRVCVKNLSQIDVSGFGFGEQYFFFKKKI